MAKQAKINVDLEALLDAGAHFGHQTKRWNPKMEEYIYGSENGVHIFDLVKTKELLEKALEFLVEAKKEGKVILILGTKKQIKDKVREVANKLKLPYVDERWLGGTISNFDMIKRSVAKLAEMREGVVNGAYSKNTKKERLLIDREIARLERFFGGLEGITKAPEVLFVIDTKKEAQAVREAKMKGVTVVGIVDTNADPDMIDFEIPMNDDASRSLTYILDLLADTLK